MLLSSLSLFKAKSKEAVSCIYEGPLGKVEQEPLNAIYHHLHPGAKVDLSIELICGISTVGVYFKGFRIGSLPQSHTPVVLELLKRGFFLNGTVKQIHKRKYLPAEQIELSITDQFTEA